MKWTGIEEKEHRNGAFDNGGQTEESDGKRKDRKKGGPGLMGEAGQEGVEIGSAGSDEADGGSEAGQDDDESQKETAHRSEIEGRGSHQHGCPVSMWPSTDTEEAPRVQRAA